MIQFLQTLLTKTSPLGVIKGGPVGGNLFTLGQRLFGLLMTLFMITTWTFFGG